MDEKVLAGWMEGFTKAAAEAGITDPAEVNQLLKTCGRLAIREKHAEAFDAGVEKAVKDFGLTKSAGLLDLLAKLGMGAKGAAGVARSPGLWETLSKLGLMTAGAGLGGRELSRAWTRTTHPFQYAQDRMTEGIRPAAEQMNEMNQFRGSLGGMMGSMGMGGYGMGGYGGAYSPYAPMPRTWMPMPSSVNSPSMYTPPGYGRW